MQSARPLLLVAAALAGLALAAFVAVRPAAARSARGSIEGVVSFSGKAPRATAVDRSSDAFCAGKTMTDEEIVVTKGKLAGVHVRIKSGTAGKHAAPKKPVVIVQKDCVYAPRVVGAMAGQALVIENGDPTMHNVHGYVDGETYFNRGQPKGSPALRETDLGEPGDVFTLKCDVHAWMRAFVPLTDHPYFDVTGKDGRFVLKNVPAGTYTVEAWHPKLGLKSQKVTVGGKGSARASFSFE